MRNRVARVARATIATNRPKSSEIVADITQSLLSTLHAAGFLRVEEHPALRKHKKHRDLPTRLPGAPYLLKISISLFYKEGKLRYDIKKVGQRSVALLPVLSVTYLYLCCFIITVHHPQQKSIILHCILCTGMFDS